MRPIPLALAFVVVAASLAWAAGPGAGAPESVEADAGATIRVAPGEPIRLEGRAFGGTPPYAFAWSGGSPARFSDVSTADPTYDTTGLVPGDLVLTLTVTDALAQTATDTVIHRVDVPSILLDVTGTVVVGVPDEILTTSLDGRAHTFNVPAGVSRLDATLDWENAANDLDLRLVKGTFNTGSQGETFEKPERASVPNPFSGSWEARVRPFLSASDTYRLVISTPPIVTLPSPSTAHPNGAYTFGRDDAQNLVVAATGGTAPYAFAWDLDGDGRLETPGTAVTTSLPPGTHDVRVRVTDSKGYRMETAARVTVRDVDHVLVARCGNVPTTPYWMMEFSVSGGACFNHIGHNTYDFGSNAYALKGGWGKAFAVEQQYSPPAGTDGLPDPFATPLLVETSLNGRDWDIAAKGRYVFLETEPLGAPDRQNVEFTLEGDGRAFRFLRVRAPQSAAQGLSGFIDSSGFDVYADVLPTDPPVVAGSFHALNCGEHIMERVFTAHPCWFGGVNRYDSASFFHTYYLGEGARPERVRAEVIVAPWRTDDFMGQKVEVRDSQFEVRVQVSSDGIGWQTIGTTDATPGVPATIEHPLYPGDGIRLVRFVADEHEDFHKWRQGWEWAPLKHLRAYIVDSRIWINGKLPSP